MLIKTVFDNLVRLNRGFDLPDTKIIEGEYPVVTSTNIKAYHNEYKIEPPCVVTGRSGSLGKVQYITEKCWPLNTALYSKDLKGNNAQYVYYFLQTMHLEQYNAGAGVPTLNQNHLQRLKVKIHPVSEQNKIVDVLSKYDELIEINNKRIKLLEQTAEELYKEWFVRFRFLNHQNTEFGNGIPKGWVKGKIKDFVEFENGFAFKSEDYLNEGKYGIVTIKNVQDGKFDDNKIEYIDDIPKRMPLYCKLNTGDILMSLTGNVGRLCFVSGNNYLLNQRLCKVISNYPYFTYNFFRQDTIYQTLCNIAYGTAQLNLSPVLARNLKVIIPSEKLMKLYNDTVSPNYEIMQKLRIQNNNLIKQRDLLLPRLMSGKLEVK